MVKKLAFFAAIGLLCACAQPGRVESVRPPTEDEIAISRADALFGKGSFIALKQAFGVFQSVYARPKYRKAVALKLFMTSILLSVREKELGISNSSYYDRALAVLRDNRALSGYLVYSEIADHFWIQGKGVMRDIDTRFAWKETADTLTNVEPGLRLKAESDEFSAYMYAVLRCAFAPAYGVSLFPEKNDLSDVWDLFPDSPLLRYKRAICPKENPEILREILAADPQFYEADYFLGNEAFARGNLLEAEDFFLKALSGIPDSPQTTISLAGIAFATEEFERSLVYYEKTLALSPEFRDALLGKAMCLSYLGRSSEAILVCEKLIGLGYWLLGESYYWLAWNQHELKDNAAAAVNIEEAKGRLPTSTEVFTLSGLLALESGNLAKAEKDLKEALQYNRSNADALMLLGDVDSRKKNWPDAAGCFERAGFVYEDEEAGLEAKIADLKKSGLPDNRKTALLQKKTRRLEKVSLAKAAAFYDAAAAYSNGGQKQKAVEMASRSVGHPSFKQKAEDLMSRIK
jgi:tetratricopeptide (TPR) repeat protein